ncbi:MAG: cation:proton antiporter [Candidatus Methanomethylophilaceae archaeon]
MDIGNVLLMLAVIFALAKSAAFVFNRFGVPGLIGEILVGILISNLVIGDWSFEQTLHLNDPEYFDILEVFAEVGVAFLLFSVGLETRVKDLTSVGRSAIMVATLGVIIPFILGYAYIEYFADGNMYHALFLGAAMVATSVGITARVIKDMKLTDTKESRIIIGAAVIDDILGMIVLAIVAGMAESGSVEISSILSITILAVAFVLIVLLFCSMGVPKIYAMVEKRNERKLIADPSYIPRKINMLSVSIAVCLGFAFLADYIGLAAIIGAFLAGMIFADYAWDWGLEEKIESINVFLVSFFFVYVGLQVDMGQITENLLLIALAVIILAIIGKYIGCSLGAKVCDRKIDRSSLNIIGIGMIPRGEVGIIVATIGMKIMVDGVPALSQELYTVVVLMSVVTTLVAPPLLASAFRKKYPPEYQIDAHDQL